LTVASPIVSARDLGVVEPAGPWLIALAVGLGLATVMTILRERRRAHGAPRS
jgi:hypothetical protein